MPACGPVLPPSEGRNPLTMIKERLPAGSFRGTKTIRLTGGSGMTLRHFLGRLPDGGSGGDLEVSRARTWPDSGCDRSSASQRGGRPTNGEHPEEDEGPDRGGTVGDPRCASDPG